MSSCTAIPGEISLCSRLLMANAEGRGPKVKQQLLLRWMLRVAIQRVLKLPFVLTQGITHLASPREPEKT